MEQKTSLLITQILALWGAVLSTLVVAWQFRDSLRQDGRLRLTIWVGRASGTDGIRPFFEFQVVNVGRLPAYFGGVVLHDSDGNFIDQALGPTDDGDFLKLEPGQACDAIHARTTNMLTRSFVRQAFSRWTAVAVEFNCRSGGYGRFAVRSVAFGWKARRYGDAKHSRTKNR